MEPYSSIRTFAVSAVLYGAIYATQTGMMCVLGIWRCRIGSNLTTGDFVLGLALASALVVGLGLIATTLFFISAALLKARNAFFSIVIAIVAGMAPHLAILAHDNMKAGVYSPMSEVELMGGIAGAVVGAYCLLQKRGAPSNITMESDT